MQELYNIKKLDDCIEYYKDGKLHRDNDLPAIEFISGSKFWYQNGELHRDNDLPAIEWNDGSKSWYQNGLLHRNNGPAYEELNGNKSWYIEGKEYSEEEFNKKIKEITNET